MGKWPDVEPLSIRHKGPVLRQVRLARPLITVWLQVRVLPGPPAFARAKRVKTATPKPKGEGGLHGTRAAAGQAAPERGVESTHNGPYDGLRETLSGVVFRLGSPDLFPVGFCPIDQPLRWKQ